MKYKEDIDKTLKNFAMWWEREDFGRCAISITAKKDSLKNDPPPPLPMKVEDRWLDFEYLKASIDHRLRNHSFIAEAIPVWDGGYPGYDSLATFFGCGITFGEETGWKSPIIAEGKLEDHDPASLVIDRENHWWRHSNAYHEFINENCAGTSIPAMTAIMNSGDTLAAIRSTNQLLFDVLESPEAVKEFERRLTDLKFELYDLRYSQHLAVGCGGSTDWMHLWAPGKYSAVYNDFSYMISTEMLERLFGDELDRHLKFLDYSIYHVDGINSFIHVDMLCSLPRLNALQILPGAGKPSPLHYMDILKKVQAAGKNLHITIAAEEVEPALDSLSSKGLFIVTSCETEAEGRDLLRLVERNSKFK